MVTFHLHTCTINHKINHSSLMTWEIQSNLTITNPLGTTEMVHCIRVFTTSGCSLHGVFTTSGCSLHQGVHYIRVFTTSGCSLHQGVHYIRVFTTWGVHYIRVFTTSGCSLHQGVHYISVFTTSGCSLHQGVHYIRVFTTSGCSLHQGAHYIRAFTILCVHSQRIHRCTFKGLCLLYEGVHCIQGSL